MFSSIRELGLMCQIAVVNACVKMGDCTFAQKLFEKNTPQVTADNLNVLKSSACEFLSVLSGNFLKSA